MRISLRFIPVILFFVFYGLLQLSFSQLRRMEAASDQQETTAILDIVSDRFKRYLELPSMVGFLGAEYLSADIAKTSYAGYASLIKQTNPEFLGFNILNAEGRIFRVYPDSGPNAKALGRLSQNLGQIIESYERKQPFYLSAPFRLFQGQQGFVFYMPVKKKNVLQGWYAVVISSERFLEKFALEDFLRVFDLVIIDEQTGLDYFATSIEPRDEDIKVFSSTATLFGRKMQFKTWRKSPTPLHRFPWYFSVGLSLILALASAFMLRLYEQRRKVRGQLDNMSILLRVTSREALSNLIEIHSEFNQLNLPEDENVERLSRDINYLTNLIEQIDLLQTMAHSREGLTEGTHSFLQILKEQLEYFTDVFDRKDVSVVFEEKDFEGITLKVNDWLFGHSVLSNVISHLLIHIEPGTILRIENQSRGSRQAVVFRVKRHPQADHSSKIVTRRIEVARKVLQLQEGDLREDYIGAEELAISVFLPR